jgi:hypothetical protein
MLHDVFIYQVNRLDDFFFILMSVITKVPKPVKWQFTSTSSSLQVSVFSLFRSKAFVTSHHVTSASNFSTVILSHIPSASVTQHYTTEWDNIINMCLTELDSLSGQVGSDPNSIWFWKVWSRSNPLTHQELLLSDQEIITREMEH